MNQLPLRILLVEDNPGDALLVREDLGAAAGRAYTVIVVPTQSEALERLAVERFDLTLLDLGLPDASGLENVAKVAAAAPDVPLIVLTGADDDQMAVQAVKSGAQDYLVKGRFDPALLRRTILHAVERKRLMEENRRLAAFPHEIPHPVLAVARDGSIIYANPAARELAGRAAEGEIAAILPPRHGELVHQCLLRGDGRLQALSEAGGRVLSWTYQASPAWGRVHLYATDLTEWATAERGLREAHDELEQRVLDRTRELQASEQRMRLVTDAMPALIAYIDAAGCFQFANSRHSDWFGLSPEQIAGRPVRDVTGETFFLSVHRQIDAVLSGRRVSFDGTVATPGGGARHFHALHLPHRDGEGRVQGFFSLVQDITERKLAEDAVRRSEEKYRALLNDAADAIVITDTDGRIREVNRRAELLYGYDAADMRAMRVVDLHPPEYRKAVAVLGAELLRTGTMRAADLPALRSDGGQIPVEISATVVAVGERKLIQAIIKDISAHRRSEEMLRGAKEAAELADRAKTEFLANMSHELRTPLNAIIGFSDIMRSELMGPLPSAQYRDYVGDIHSSGLHLLEVINEILDMSKIESGQMELYPEPVALIDTVRMALRLVSERAVTAEVGLSVEVPPGLPDLLVDVRRFKQILLNLLSNAVKFTPPGGKVAVTAWREDDGGLTLAVIDSGIGMSEEDIAKAMTAFGQVDSTLARRFEGTGLGLPLSKAFVELHDGRLELDSRLGTGTTVRICLPPHRVVELAAEDTGAD